ncbi:helix-turn-helix domain-containing protein [Acetobacter senegalensis]|uniref:helix-turn-helix domain-containing protein n=1 Tax=Acetobacter senegalensis TaxID=446692 RepID=UPI001EDB5C9B|nr:helix-turn-helix domain-containing protein [Acetobacter senegalensis]MCG4272513.1 helix-turn-helix domain-containing protein [Acetobacter senegalensis]
MPRKPEIPSFLTYGINTKTDDIGFVHVENVMDRKSLHNGHVPAHRHEQIFQLCFWTDGSGTYVIEDRLIEFQAPMFVFIPARVVHGFSVSSGSDAIVFSLASSYTDTDPLFKSTAARTPLVLAGPEQPKPTPLMLTLMQAGYERYRIAPETSQSVIRGLAIAILGEALSLTRSARVPDESAAAVRIRSLIEEHFRDAWSITDYARALGQTPYQINTTTQAAFGQSLKRLIIERRLLESKRLLAFTIRPIEAIAAEVGIPDPAYFSRFFHTFSGLSPREWRRQWAENTKDSLLTAVPDNTPA